MEACLECSAMAVLNIQQVFYFAKKAVVYPIAPLFDLGTSELQPALVKALTRIFRIFDLNQDGVLSNDELNKFQVRLNKRFYLFLSASCLWRAASARRNCWTHQGAHERPP